MDVYGHSKGALCNCFLNRNACSIFFFFGLVHPGFVVCHMFSDICSLSSKKKATESKKPSLICSRHGKSSSHFTDFANSVANII